MILFLHITRVQRVIFISFYGWWHYTFTSWLWYVTIVPVCMCVSLCVCVYVYGSHGYVRVRARLCVSVLNVCVCMHAYLFVFVYLCMRIYYTSCFSYTRTTRCANDRDGVCACFGCMGESKCIAALGDRQNRVYIQVLRLCVFLLLLSPLPLPLSLLLLCFACSVHSSAHIAIGNVA